ncbi:MAG: hypothetical protein NTU49_08475 [Gammaproteobacteria bacterium]|nr:hypothetical protein [Gammaproteobacteria bacterium]
MLQLSQSEFNQILNDPSSAYTLPVEVVHDKRLSREQKIAVLKLWAFDAREIEIAQEENMRGDASPLHQVLIALKKVE